VSIHDLCKSNHDYYPKKYDNTILSVIIPYTFRPFNFPTGTASFIVLPFYCSTVIPFYYSTVLPFYCSTVLLNYFATVILCYHTPSFTVVPFYCSTVLLYYCTSVRLSVYSWLVQVQPWLLSKKYNNSILSLISIFFKTIRLFLLALNHSLCYRCTELLCLFAIVLLY
jgi:hypothetical protein